MNENDNDYNELREVFIVVLILVAIGLGCCTGCAHNGLMVAKGKVFLINERGLTYVNGTVVTAMERENTKLDAQVKDDDAVGQQNDEQRIAGDIDVKYEIGKQITGYLVDLAKVAPEAAVEYLKKLPKNEPSEDTEEKTVLQEENSIFMEQIRAYGERLDAIEEVLTAPTGGDK